MSLIFGECSDQAGNNVSHYATGDVDPKAGAACMSPIGGNALVFGLNKLFGFAASIRGLIAPEALFVDCLGAMILYSVHQATE